MAPLHKPDTLRGLLVGAGAALIAVLLGLTPQWHSLEMRAFDWLSTFQPPVPADPNAIVVAIDEPSFGELGLPWPWPRSLHAELIETLRAAGARVVALDVIFAEASADPAADAALAAALGPDNVLAADLTVVDDANRQETIRTLPHQPFIAPGKARFGFPTARLDSDGVWRRLGPDPEAFASQILGAAGAAAAAPQAPADALIQFFGGPRRITTYSYYQVLDRERWIPEVDFKGKTVIVGLSLLSAAGADKNLADAFVTPATATSHARLSGAEVQATILENLRLGLFITPAPGLVSLALCLLAAVLALQMLVRFGIWRAAFTAVGGIVVIALGGYLVLRYGRIWVPPLAPALSLLLTVVGCTGFSYLEERAQRRWIIGAFSHYLSPEMVDKLARDPQHLKLGGEVRELSILFCDIRGFTTISEGMKDDPERLTKLVNRILTPLSNAVLAQGGTIDKYIGDCIMALWNAPIDEPDHAVRAVTAARNMLQAIVKLNQELAREAAAEGRPVPSIAIGVGVNTGRCVVGNMGSERRFDYSALGDAVNLASRLESATKDCGVEVVIGPETARQIEGRVATRRIGEIRVKGKAEAVVAYTLAD